MGTNYWLGPASVGGSGSRTEAVGRTSDAPTPSTGGQVRHLRERRGRDGLRGMRAGPDGGGRGGQCEPSPREVEKKTPGPGGCRQGSGRCTLGCCSLSTPFLTGRLSLPCPPSQGGWPSSARPGGCLSRSANASGLRQAPHPSARDSAATFPSTGQGRRSDRWQCRRPTLACCSLSTPLAGGSVLPHKGGVPSLRGEGGACPRGNASGLRQAPHPSARGLAATFPWRGREKKRPSLSRQHRSGQAAGLG